MAVVLAVDPGEVRIGLAVSDPSGTIARPLRIIRHTARVQDAERIAQAAREHQAESILVGLALDAEGEIGYQARKALRLCEAIRAVTDIEVITADESYTTMSARKPAGMKRRDTELDARAAAYLLQEYLDAK